MTTIPSQQGSKSDDTASRAQRRTGKAGAGADSTGPGSFSSLFAASRNKLRDATLRAERLAISADEAAASRKASASSAAAEEDETKDWYGSATPAASDEPPPQQDAQQAAGAADVPVHASTGARMNIDAEDSPDLLLLTSLLPAGGDDGIFEVLLPAGARLGVAVSDMPDGLSYLLMPDSAKLASRLRGNEMELEGYLRRRIRRNVRVAVL